MTRPAAVGPLGAGVPQGLVVSPVHGEVAVVLHAQAVGVAHASGVRRPDLLPAVDHKVTVFLQGERYTTQRMGGAVFQFPHVNPVEE